MKITHDRFLEILEKTESGASQRQTCVSEQERNAFRYMLKKHVSAGARFCDFPAHNVPVQIKDFDLKSEVQEILRAAIYAAKTYCHERPHCATLAKEILRAYIPAFKETTVKGSFTPQDYRLAISDLLTSSSS